MLQTFIINGERIAARSLFQAKLSYKKIQESLNKRLEKSPITENIELK